MSRVRAFTGPSKLSDEQVEFVEDVLNTLDEVDEVRTGAANGLDSIAAHLQWYEYPAIRHRLFVPGAPHNKKLVNHMGNELDVEVVQCPKLSTFSDTYRRRNEMMLDGATELEAFTFNERFYRSGEWMTINIARRLGVKVTIHVIP